jgi:simple sugar transport system ATP-binding protein
MAQEAVPLFSMRGITKTFFGVPANRGVDFDLFPGEVHALLGENGAGKTTLMSVLCGLYAPDEGTVEVGGRRVRFTSPGDSIAAGIGMVHQHFSLVPVLAVWENMILGLPLPWVLPRRAVIDRIRELSDRYGLAVDPEAPIHELSIGERQRVEILKLLYRGAKVLILDEPTSVLTPGEVRELFGVVRRMTAEGHGMIFISHKMDEVLEISDRLTILRKGERVGTIPARGASRAELARMMVGRPVAPPVRSPRVAPVGKPALEVEDLAVLNDRGVPAVRGATLSVRGGEILGLAGVAGNGQTELCEAVAGLRPVEAGRVLLNAEDVTALSVRRRIDRGLSYIPADRKGVGLIPNMNLRENMALKKYWRPPAARRFCCVDWEYLAGLTGALVQKFEVVHPSLASPIRNLSGGNLQKLMLARELDGAPSVVLAMTPTWGLDVGATEFVHQCLVAERDRGAAVLLISEDLEELFALSDRLAVLFRGQVVGTLSDPRPEDRERIGLWMAGQGTEGSREGRGEAA